jgi:aminoglycoside phosphotransferase
LKDILTYIDKNKDILGIDEYKIDFLQQGEYNINYLITTKDKKFVLRLNSKSQMNLPNQIRYEYDTLKFLEKSGVTPKVYYVDDSDSKLLNGVILMEYLDGRSLIYEKDREKAAYIFSKIHSIDASNANNFIVEKNLFQDRISEANFWLKEVFESKKVSKEHKGFFEKFLNYLEKNKYKEKYFEENRILCLNNTEVNSGNFIIGEKPYLIDWEKAVISDPCQDITHFLVITTTKWKTDFIASKEYEDKFFEEYEKFLNKKINIKERVHLYKPYMYSRALSWCMNAYLEYLKEDKLIKNEDTFRKIKEFTDLDFMKNLIRDYF